MMPRCRVLFPPLWKGFHEFELYDNHSLLTDDALILYVIFDGETKVSLIELSPSVQIFILYTEGCI